MRFLSLSAVPCTVGLLTIAASCLLAPGVVLAQPNIEKADDGKLGPVVTIVSPQYSDVIKDSTAIVIAVAPRRYPAQNVELLVDGKAVSGVLGMQTRFKWDTKLFVDGPHTLTVRVTDSQGFIGQSETTIYINNNRKVDDKSPILRWLGAEQNQTLSGLAKIRLQAGDAFGVKYVFLNLNSAITPDIKPPLASWMTNRPPYEFSIETDKYENGMYVLDAYAWDDMENERNAPRLTVRFHNDASMPREPLLRPENIVRGPDKPGTALAKSEASRMLPVTSSPDSPQISSAPALSAGLNTGTRLATVTSSAKISEPPIPAKGLPAIPSPNTVVMASKNPPRVAKTPVVKTPAVKAPVVSANTGSNSEAATDSAPNNATRIAEHTATPAVSRTPEITPAAPGVLPGDAMTSSQSTSSTRIAAAPRTRWTAPKAATRLQMKHTTPPAITQTSIAAPMPDGARSTPTLPLSVEAGRRSANLQLTSMSGTPALAARAVQTEKVLPKTPSVKTRGGQNALDARVTAILNAPAAPRLSESGAFALSESAGVESASTPSLPTVPRLAFSPDVKTETTPRDQPLAGAAIVVSPDAQAPTVHVATRNVTLAAIAAHYKMPVSAIATANNLQANARVAKGAKVHLPRSLTISYQGQAVTGDVAPLLMGTTSVIPFRFLFQQQGGTLFWDETAQRVTARNDNYEVTLEIGNDKAVVNEKEVLMDMAAFLLSGRTMVPARFFETALHAKVEWEPSTGRIFVATTRS